MEKFLAKNFTTQCFFIDHLNRKTINKTTCRTPSVNPHQLWAHYTAWKVSKKGVISGLYFPVFSTNTGKCWREITPYLDTFHAVLVRELLCWYDYLGFSDSFGRVSSIIFKFSTITVKTITICKLNFISFFYEKSRKQEKEAGTETPKACNFIKKSLWVFSYEFCEISKNTFFTEHLWTIASG